MPVYNLRSRSDMEDEIDFPLSENIKSYFESLISPLVTSEELKNSLDTFQKGIVDRITSLETRLTEKEAIIENNEKTIERLDSELKVVKNALDLVQRQGDDTEQYTRRYSLRIQGIPVTNGDENVMELVKTCYNEVNVDFESDDIDRAHRTGKAVYDKIKKTYTQPILVKFRNWNARLKLYKARPKFVKEQDTSGRKPGRRKFSVVPDLTTRRYNLLKYARGELSNGNYDHIKFVFADVNCSLGVMFNDGDLKFFNSVNGFHDIIGPPQDT